MTNSVSEFFPVGKDGSVEDQAAAWFAYLRSGHDTEAGRADFSAWLQQDPSHVHAYTTIKQAWEAFAEVDRVEERLTVSANDVRQDELSARFEQPRSVWRGWSTAAAALVAVTLGLGVAAGALHQLLSPASDAVQVAAQVETLRFQTGVGEVETVSLPDGSVITLSGDTRLQVRLGEIREVVLSAGQAYFEVAHDVARPFEVRAGAAEVRVVGTAFDIRHGANAVAVSVTEGRVRLTSAAVSTEEESALSMLLTPRQQAVLFDDGAVRRGAFDAERTLAWRQRRFYFEDASLCDLIIDVNRFTQTPVSATDPDACEMRVSASFDSEQIDQTLEAVAHSLGLTLERRSGEIRLVSMKG